MFKSCCVPLLSALLLSIVFQQSEGSYKNIDGQKDRVTHHHGGDVYCKRIRVKRMDSSVFGGVLNLVIEILVGLGSELLSSSSEMARRKRRFMVCMV